MDVGKVMDVIEDGEGLVFLGLFVVVLLIILPLLQKLFPSLPTAEDAKKQIRDAKTDFAAAGRGADPNPPGSNFGTDSRFRLPDGTIIGSLKAGAPDLGLVPNLPPSGNPSSVPSWPGLFDYPLIGPALRFFFDDGAQSPSSVVTPAVQESNQQGAQEVGLASSYDFPGAIADGGTGARDASYFNEPAA